MADRWLRPTLSALVGLTGTACLQAAFFPLGPSATLGPPPGPISVTTATLLPPRPGRRERDLALSATERLELRPIDGDGAMVELKRTALSARSPKHLQVAAMTAADPSLALQKRRLISVASGEIGMGTIAGQVALQGCRTGNSRSVMSAHRAAQAVTHRPASARAEKLSRLLGLSPNSRYDCELITLTTTPGAGAEARLMAVWDQIKPGRNSSGKV